MPDTNRQPDIRYPVVDVFTCPYCGAYIGDIINVNSERWVRVYNQPANPMCGEGITVTADFRNFDGRCGRCLRSVHFHG